jgi:hypothetical protein
MLLIFSTPVLIRHLWQLKTVVFPHWCQICAVLFKSQSEMSYHMTLISDFQENVDQVMQIMDSVLTEWEQNHRNGVA